MIRQVVTTVGKFSFCVSPVNNSKTGNLSFFPHLLVDFFFFCLVTLAVPNLELTNSLHLVGYSFKWLSGWWLSTIGDDRPNPSLFSDINPQKFTTFVEQLGECVCSHRHVSVPLVTSEQGKPLQAYLDHVERFLGLVQGDGLSALLLDVQLQMVLQVTANTWNNSEKSWRQRKAWISIILI